MMKEKQNPEGIQPKRVERFDTLMDEIKPFIKKHKKIYFVSTKGKWRVSSLVLV